MAVIHISDTSISVSDLLVHIRAGNRVVIEEESIAIAFVGPTAMVGGASIDKTPRRVSEIIAQLKRNPLPPTEPNFAFADAVEAGIREREHERLIDPWEAF